LKIIQLIDDQQFLPNNLSLARLKQYKSPSVPATEFFNNQPN
jgi:hypothetical protein